MFNKHIANQSVSPEMNPSDSNAMFLLPGTRLRHWHLLLLIMLVSYILRLMLVSGGGQFYFPDEIKYIPAVSVADNIMEGDYKSAAGSLLQYRTHAGATAVRLIPAFIHRLAYELQGDDRVLWHDYWRNQTGDFRFSAIFFAIPSVLSIGMIYLIALEAGAQKDEALLSAFLLAASNTWFVYSRHFLPYDSSLFLALIALFVALRYRHSGIKGALLLGVVMFCAFWVYFSHYFFMLAIAFLYCVLLARNPLDLVARPIAILFSASLLLVPVLLYNHLVLDTEVFTKMQAAGLSITRGDFNEGLVLPFTYFRDTEGAIALVWLVGIVVALRQVFGSRQNFRHRAILWLACLAFLYLSMAALSSGFQLFILLGRLVRPMVPIVILICAFSFTPILKRIGFKFTILILAAVSIVSANNFSAAINQPFFREVAREVLKEYDSVSLETTFLPPARTFNLANKSVEGARYLLVNADFYFPITEMTDRPEGKVILEISHPFNYRPSQYETMTPETREIVNRNGMYIWLIDTQAASEN